MGIAIVSVAAGLLFATAVVAVVAGLIPADPVTVAGDPVDRPQVGRRSAVMAAVVVAAAAAWWATGWPVAAVLTVAAVWLVPAAVRQAARHRGQQRVLDATRMWLLQLRTSLRAGVGLESALRDTARLARPDSPLSGPLRRLVERLDWLPTATALDWFAGEVDNHVADAATVVLRSALTHSNQGIAATLQALGEWADEDLRHLRRVEAQARGLRLAKRVVLTIWAAMAVYLALSSPDLMAPYSTVEGQAVLLVLLATAGLALWLLGRWSTVHRSERFFHQPTRPEGSP